jgi:uncharacterized protein (DUF58 family)
VNWLSRLRSEAWRGWADPPGPDLDEPLLSSAFLRRVESLSLSVGRRSTTGFVGEHSSVRKAHSVEFSDYRDYRPGDDMRLIDWNVYARLGQLTLRLTEAAEATTLYLLIDCSASMSFGAPSKFRTAQRVAAALGCLALSRYDSVVITPLRDDAAQVLPRLRAKNETGRLLSVLESLRPRGALDLSAALHSFCGKPRRGLCVLISDLLARTSLEEHLRAFRHIGLEPVVIQVLVPDEARPRIEGALDLVDCETGAKLLTDVNAQALRAYEARFKLWTAELEAACLVQHTLLIRLLTSQPLEEALFMAIRGRLVQ